MRVVDTAPAPPGELPRRRPSIVKRVVVASLVAGVVLTLSGGAYWSWAMGGSKAGDKVRVVIPDGSSAADIASILARKDVIRSAFVFRIVARMRGVASDFKPGAYDLRRGLGVSGVIDILRKGIPLKIERFTVPEGKTVRQIARIVGENTHISAQQFLAELAKTRDVPEILPGNPPYNFEGLLFPKTYEILAKASARDVVRSMLDQFEKETASLNLRARGAELGLTPYQLIITASLIEREARIAKDRPLIASVIYNRLARPMRLQIDATVQYAIELQTGEYKGERLTQQDYTRVRSPYNTYLHDGLPPGPIAAPGLAAIEAALDPATTGYYYYVLCDERGGHAFAKSGSEFNRLVARCR